MQLQLQNDEGKKTCREMLTDWKATERSMPLLMKSNPNAKNDKIGKLRETIATSIGGYQMSYQDQLKCRAALPRFQDMDQVKAIKDSKENGNEARISFNIIYIYLTFHVCFNFVENGRRFAS